MTPTPSLENLIQSVIDETPGADPAAQLAQAAEYAAGLSQLGDRLLDHFVFRCRQAGMSWAELSTALGVTKQAAHKRFTGLNPTFQRFTVKAQAAAQGSIELARGFGHASYGTEHMLLALFEPSDSLAALTLAELEVGRQVVLDALLEHKPRTDAQLTEAIPPTVHAREAMRGALNEALGLGHNYIGTEHLLLAVLREEDYSSRRILTGLGVDGEAVRAALVRRLEELTAARPAQQKSQQSQ